MYGEIFLRCLETAPQSLGLRRRDTIMKTTHQYVVDLGEEQIEKITSLLELAENADQQENAIWFGDDDRTDLGDIREEIEAQTSE